MRNTLKKLLLVDMLYAFIAAALAVMVPIYLVDIEMDITSIGLVLSAIPLGFMLLRIVFAAIADRVGTKTVEVMESVAMLLAIAIYALTRSARAFAIAQFSEGVRDAGFWATARTDILKASHKKHLDRAFAYFIGVRQLADGIGRVVIGIVLVYFSFQTSFSILFFLSLGMFVLILTINKNPFKKFAVDKKLLRMIFHKRSRHFWQHSLGVTLQQLIPAVLLGFLLPVYLYAEVGFDYYGTATLLAIFSLVVAIANLLALRFRLSSSAILFTVFLMIPAFVLLPYLNGAILVPLLVLAIGSGCGNILTEKIISMEVKKRGDVSTDIGALYFPLMTSLFLFTALGGAVIEAWGYETVFYFSAFLTLYYVIYAMAAFKKE